MQKGNFIAQSKDSESFLQDKMDIICCFFSVKTGYRDQYFIGLNDLDIQMKFQWTDGMAVTYTNWAFNEPNNWQNRPEDCVTIYQTVRRRKLYLIQYNAVKMY